jgi:hypothetical protein
MRVDENSPNGTFVGTVHADDPDGNAVRYSLVGDFPFEIDPVSGEISVNGGIDFESVPQYVVTIAAEDQQSPNLVRQTLRTIEVNDVNDVPEIESAVFEISEDAPNGSVVGRVPAFDQDRNSRLSFLLIGNSPFTIDASTGVITLKNSAQLDANRQSTYPLSVIVADNHVPPATASAVVTVNVLPTDDEPSEPPIITGLAASLTHNATAPIPIASKVVISDSDTASLLDGLVRVSAVPAAPTDQFSIAARDGITVLDGAVRVDGILVGIVLESGRNGSPLSVIFNSNATLPRVERLLRKFEYQSLVLLISQKNLDIEINDGRGGRVLETIRLSAVEPIVGDFSQDGTLDAVDLDILAMAIRQQRDEKFYDLDSDGIVDNSDHRFWVTDIKKTWLGDSNLDGVFDSSDLVAIFQANKFERDVDAAWAEGDWNGDGRFTTADLVAAFQDGGYERDRRG